MFDDVDEALDNAGAASPEDLKKAVDFARVVVGAVVPGILSTSEIVDVLIASDMLPEGMGRVIRTLTRSHEALRQTLALAQDEIRRLESLIP